MVLNGIEWTMGPSANNNGQPRWRATEAKDIRRWAHTSSRVGSFFSDESPSHDVAREGTTYVGGVRKPCPRISRTGLEGAGNRRRRRQGGRPKGPADWRGALREPSGSPQNTAGPAESLSSIGSISRPGCRCEGCATRRGSQSRPRICIMAGPALHT
ncbi:hypothetical protein BO71DRAFT_59211 [Aspergillus ellipticus CBS 707.79]|uniref:Uncharacterized protein n=1 Tax=Aspergillus ellipticus CBS 707.79 TaxID=1448320 RepID=A0A319D1W5_9EURO|nr:hypothetical protein BO71DRAFT_59211 [Aspergillus ellipticus CBS 707.79]